MSSADPFRVAVEAEDLEAMAAALHPDVVLHSPVAFAPFVGKAEVSALLAIIFETLSDFSYTDELAGPGTTALIFRARIADRQAEGLDLLRRDEHGLIVDFTVMFRPLSAVIALAQAVGPRLSGHPVLGAHAAS